VYDYGSQLKCETGSRSEIELAVLLAKEKGWKGLKITGDNDFKEAVFMEAVLSGAFKPGEITGYVPTAENLKLIAEFVPAEQESKDKVLRRVLPEDGDAEQGGGQRQNHAPRLKL
jgi:hypothetical protein